MAFLLEWYEKGGDALVGDEALPGLSVHSLREILSLPRDMAVADLQPVTLEHARRLAAHVRHSFDFDAHDYFVAPVQDS